MVRLGQRLHKERLRQKLTLDEIANAIKIKPAFLSAIERGEYHKLPSVSYAQGFVQNYSSYLGIPKAEITALFKREFDEKKSFKVLPDALVAQKEIPIHRLKIQQSLLLAGGLFCVFAVYLLFQYRAAFMPPSLVIASPKENSVTTQEVTVSGFADPNATVFVNGVSVPVTNDGSYSRRLMLFPGKAVITIKAVNRFGKESVINRNIVVR
jgi:cytoskeletal protein RodZ